MVDAQKRSLGASKGCIYFADSAELLQSEKVWDVVYLDPMFLPQKKCSPKRDLQILREISDVAPSSNSLSNLSRLRKVLREIGLF